MKKDGYVFFLTGWRNVNKRHLINYARNFLSSMVNYTFWISAYNEYIRKKTPDGALCVNYLIF